MSNIPNYIQKTEIIHSFSQQPHFYKITNQINDKYYYGVHNGSDTQNYEGSGVLLHMAYEKYGKENFIKEILKEFDNENEAYKYEELIVDENMINKNNPMCYNICKGGKGGDTFSCQTSERQTEIIQKKKNTHNNQTPEKKAEISQKCSNNIKKRFEDMTPEQWEEWCQKCSDSCKKYWDEITPEEKEKWIQKFSGENSGMLGKKHTQDTKDNISVANSGENNGNYTQYRHPYNPDFIGNGRKISNDIKKNYPNKPQWNQITRRKKNELIIN